MGYTNYWTPNKEKLNTLTVFPQEVIDQIKKVKEKFNEEVLTKKRNFDFVEGKIEKDSIVINGSCEGFEFDLCKDSHTGDRIGVDSWKFCKTAREPYDAVIKCILMVLTAHGLILKWTHDDNGNCTEHRKAVALAKKCNIPVVHHYYPARDVAE
jgi:hypothetical protein